MHVCCTYDQSVFLSVGVHVNQTSDQDPPLSDLFLFPDESGTMGQDPCQAYPVLHSPLISPPGPSTHHDSDDFCILDTPGLRAIVRQSTVYLLYLDARAKLKVPRLTHIYKKITLMNAEETFSDHSKCHLIIFL